MVKLGLDFISISESLFLLFIGLIAIVVSLFRLKSKDFSLLNFGFFCSIYGFRWLIEFPVITTSVGLPLAFPYLHTLLTYISPIPLTAFLLNVFGRGIYNSIIWCFRSTIIFAIAAVIYDIFRTGPTSGPSINPIVVFIWCLIGMVNLLFIKGQHKHELLVMRTVFIFVFLCVLNDNLVSLRLLPWETRFEHIDMLVLCLCLGYVAGRHFFTTEKQLLNIEQELAIAMKIQRSNLPDNFPNLAPFAITARYIPMTAVAGDFYDFQAKGKSGVGIFIADVSGHGVGAALVASMLKIAFNSQLNNIYNPALVLMEINRILQGKVKDLFITAFSLYLDIEIGKLRYSNAGHPPPLLWRKSTKEIFRLAAVNTVLGPFPDIVYENEELSLAEEDRLLIYTDGLAEIKNKGNEEFGEQRLEAMLEAHSADSADITADRIIESLFKWSGRIKGTSLDDDLTLIIVDILSKPELKPNDEVSSEL